jgi:hypothetical protein
VVKVVIDFGEMARKTELRKLLQVDLLRTRSPLVCLRIKQWCERHARHAMSSEVMNGTWSPGRSGPRLALITYLSRGNETWDDP